MVKLGRESCLWKRLRCPAPMLVNEVSSECRTNGMRFISSSYCLVTEECLNLQKTQTTLEQCSFSYWARYFKMVRSSGEKRHCWRGRSEQRWAGVSAVTRGPGLFFKRQWRLQLFPPASIGVSKLYHSNKWVLRDRQCIDMKKHFKSEWDKEKLHWKVLNVY